MTLYELRNHLFIGGYCVKKSWKENYFLHFSAQHQNFCVFEKYSKSHKYTPYELTLQDISSDDWEKAGV